MEPQSQDCGKAYKWERGDVEPKLQWSRSHKTAESDLLHFAVACEFVLQWSRSHKTAERYAPTVATHCNTPLQWSRSHKTAERGGWMSDSPDMWRFNGAAVTRLRKGVSESSFGQSCCASMEPQSQDCGKVCFAGSAIAIRMKLQWSRSHKTAERKPTRHCWVFGPRCFNGAAVTRLRKDVSPASTRPWIESLQWSRSHKTAERNCWAFVAPAIRPLQWSRSHKTAER